MKQREPGPVEILRSHKQIVFSCGREYHIFVSVPAEAPPPGGFPVLYVLDANAVFGTMTEAIRAQSRFPERTGVHPAIVVGIGYPTDAPFHRARHFDFTLPVPRAGLPPSPDGVCLWGQLQEVSTRRKTNLPMAGCSSKRSPKHIKPNDKTHASPLHRKKSLSPSMRELRLVLLIL